MKHLIHEAFPIKKGAPRLDVRRVGYSSSDGKEIRWITDSHEKTQEQPDKHYSAVVVLCQGVREAFEQMGLPYQRVIHSLQWRILRAGHARNGFTHEIPMLSVQMSGKMPGLFHLSAVNNVAECLFHGNMSIAERAYFDQKGRLSAMVGRPVNGPYFIHPARLKTSPVVEALVECEQIKVIANLDTLIAHGYPEIHKKDWMTGDIVKPLVTDVVRRVFPH